MLLGVRAGALLASQAFADGLGDGMMLWAPPKSGREQLIDTLRRSIVADMMVKPNLPPRTREDVAEQLERGHVVNVDGYLWSRKLWHDSLSQELRLPSTAEKRPWHIVDFKGLPATAIPSGAERHYKIVVAERFWEVFSSLVPRTPVLFDTALSLLNEFVDGHAA
jgi:hypothetical protein